MIYRIRAGFGALAFLFCQLCIAQPPTYTITTVAGTGGTSGFAGDGGQATSAQLAIPFGIFLDSAGNLYIADQGNSRIRKVGTDGNINTVAGNGTKGYNSSDEGKAATSAELANPLGVVADSSGNLYISDTGNQVVRKVSGGNINTYAGTPSVAGYAGENVSPTGSTLNNPSGMALDSSGNLYIADTTNNIIRKVSSASTPLISTVAGNLTGDFGGDGGPAKSAELKNPQGIALDAAGNLYIADTNNHRIRKVAAGTNIISTIAGTGTAAYSGDGGPAKNASLNYPKGVAVDAAGNIYIADSFNNVIRVVLASNGNIYTIAGTRAAGYSGDQGPARSARLYSPTGIAIASAGIYIADNQNQVIRLLTPNAPAANLPAINAGGVVSAGEFGAFTSVTPGTWIEIYGSNLAGNTRPWNTGDFKGATAPTSLDGTQVAIGGQNAFIDYISPGQVNAQVPSTVGFGSQPVVVMTAAGSSSQVSVTVNGTQPGLWAPRAWAIGGKQYAGGQLDASTYALPVGAVPGITTRPAKPGDTVTFYGIGFGTVNPATAGGQIASGITATTSPVEFDFGDAAVMPSYAGLAPGFVGLYQFNVTVPNVAAGDAVPLTFKLGGVPGTQTLYIAIAQ